MGGYPSTPSFFSNQEEAAEALRTLKDLQFEDGKFPVGQSLVMVKNQIECYSGLLTTMFDSFGMSNGAWKGFMALATVMQLIDENIDAETIEGQFFETCGYPEDDTDLTQKTAILMSPVRFAALLVRVANQRLLMTEGEATTGLASPFADLMEAQAPMLALPGYDTATIQTLRAPPPDASDFAAPSDFRGLGHTCWMDIQIGDATPERVTFELNADAAPNATYNFFSLCIPAADAKMSLLSGTPLTFENCPFHRVCAGAFIQGGDIEYGNGTGKTSIYGGVYNDEEWGLAVKHDGPYILSSAHAGTPNTNSSQFFITQATQAQLDGYHVVFGRVIAGQEIIQAIGNVPVAEVDEFEDVPKIPCRIAACGQGT